MTDDDTKLTQIELAAQANNLESNPTPVSYGNLREYYHPQAIIRPATRMDWLASQCIGETSTFDEDNPIEVMDYAGQPVWVDGSPDEIGPMRYRLPREILAEAERLHLGVTDSECTNFVALVRWAAEEAEYTIAELARAFGGRRFWAVLGVPDRRMPTTRQPFPNKGDDT